MLIALFLSCVVTLAGAAQDVKATSAIIASLVDTSNDDEPLELVELLESVTFSSSTLHQHLYVNINPVWGDLAAAEGSSLEWTACGGQFRLHWHAEFDANTYSSASDLFRDARQHSRCGVASAVVCANAATLKHHQFEAHMDRTMSRLSAATSSELEWRDSTPQHQRPVGIVTLNASNMHQCRALLAPESTLCTQHMVTILSRNSGDHLLDDVSMTYPEVLSSAWHELTLQIRRNATHVVVRKRLRFVAGGKLVAWVREHVPPNVGASVVTNRQTSSPSVPDWSLQWSSQSTERGEGVIEVVVATPTNVSLAQQHAQLLMMFPTTQLRPLLHTIGESKHYQVVRLLHDHSLATLSVVVEILPSAYQKDRHGMRAVLRLPYVPVFGTLSQRPPDANKRYVLPQPILQVPVATCPLSGQAPSGWSLLFVQNPKQCYAWFRTPAEYLVHVSLPVPDSAMVFNAVSIALLPFSVLLGTILRKTGRDV
jgi:hypothetical protein